MINKKLKKYIKKEYNRDKIWCIQYHNAGDIEMYNMLFGRLQSFVGVDTEFKLGLGLLEDMDNNIPWNKKMLAGYINNIAEFDPSDVENKMKK